MEGSLFEQAKAYLTPDVIQRAGALVGESPASTRRALDVAVPTVVAGLAGDAPNVAQAGRVMRVLGDTGLDATTDGITERLGAGSGEELIQLGKGMLDRIFGDRLSGVVEPAAAASGVSSPSMRSLLALAAPLVLGALGREVHAKGLDATGVASLLAQQKNAAQMALPRSVLGAVRGGDATRAEVRPKAKEETHAARLWPLLLLIPVAIIGALLLRKRDVPAPTPRGGLGVGLPAQEAPVAAPPPGAPTAREVEIKLPSGERVKVAEGSTAYELARFLETPGGEPTRRFSFDALVFDHASGRLSRSSLATIDEVATVLNAYPSTEILVEGHTDDTGDPAGNVQLSQNRANAVKGALVARGIAADRIATAGVGQEKPIAPNDTEEGRAKNRRTELVVTRR